jgi:hypothetical protein
MVERCDEWLTARMPFKIKAKKSFNIFAFNLDFVRALTKLLCKLAPLLRGKSHSRRTQNWPTGTKNSFIG